MRTTIKTGNGYRVPTCNIHEIRIEGQNSDLSIFGKHVDRLGQYEDSGLEPEDLKALTEDDLRALKEKAGKRKKYV